MARHIDIGTNEETAIVEACKVLSDGFPIALPTETVYGLAADATNPLAITRIYETKGRPRFNPLIAQSSDTANPVTRPAHSPSIVALPSTSRPSSPKKSIVASKSSTTIPTLSPFKGHAAQSIR